MTQQVGSIAAGRINFNAQKIDTAFNRTLQRWDYRMATEEDDLNKVLDQFAEILEERLRNGKRKFAGMKAWLILTVEYHSKKFPDKEPFCLYLRSSNYLILTAVEIPDLVRQMYQEIIARNANVIHTESNIIIRNIHYLTVCMSRFEPLAAAQYQQLPHFLSTKKCIINVENRDEKCFGWSIAAAMDANQAHSSRVSKRLSGLFQYYHLDTLKYPVAPTDIPEIETKLNLKINVFSFYDNEGKARYPMYISKKKEFTEEIDLLYWNEHYAWIKSFSGFIFDLSGGNRKKFFCKRCFGLFTSSNTFNRHEQICSRPDFTSIIYRFPAPGNYLKFINVRNQLQAPFVIYADFECLILPVDEDDKMQPTAQKRRRKTLLYGSHVPCSVGLYIVPSSPGYFSARYETHTGADVVFWFLKRLLEIQNELRCFMLDEKKLVMTKEDWAKFNAASKCSICQQLFTDRLDRVRDHDHMTGAFRGAAHTSCNLKLQQTNKIPIFLHNFRGYDSHLIALGIDAFPQTPIRVIGQGYEKYLVLSFGNNMIFKDSLQFLGSSLEHLVQDLLKGGEEKFYHLRAQFPDLSSERFKLLLRKGVYPYEYMDSWKRLEESILPPREAFFSSLKQSTCSIEDYLHAQIVWKEFECKTLHDYENLYLKTDVLLLADVFENFRQLSLKTYRLDPAHYVSSPHLSWDAMLLDTRCKLQLISDPAIFDVIDRGMRGGVSMIVHRYAKANNPEMGNLFDSAKALSYIVDLDANNLYGWAMNQPLPFDDFQFLSEEEFSQLDWKALRDEDDYGYIIDCDLQYPHCLHDAHNDFPLAPEKRLIQYEQLNETHLRILSHYNIPKSSLKVQKLIPHLLDRYNYVVHYRNLKFYLEEGMQLKKIHSVIRFKQRPWLQSYIQKNSKLRADAKTDFDKNQYKLYNNSIYGKTCENQKKRTDIRLVNTQAACKRLCELPHCRGFRIFRENLAAIDLRKVEAKIDKPFYVGFTVLELSKLHMYRFHYRYIRRHFAKHARLLFTDTDSLMYWFTDCNPWPRFWQDRNEYFDFASYPKSHKYYDPTNNKVIGMFKDEALGNQVTEFVGLRPKMYSFLINEEESLGKHTAKGIQAAVANKLKHADYLEQLNVPKENRLLNRRIGQKLHKIYTIQTNKRGLCSFDDKRVILEDGVSTMAYGHYSVTGQVIHIGLDPTVIRSQISVMHSIAGDHRSVQEYNPTATLRAAKRLAASTPGTRAELKRAQLAEEEREESEDALDEIDLTFCDEMLEGGWEIA